MGNVMERFDAETVFVKTDCCSPANKIVDPNRSWQNYKVHAHVITGEYAARVQDLRTYDSVR